MPLEFDSFESLEKAMLFEARIATLSREMQASSDRETKMVAGILSAVLGAWSGGSLDTLGAMVLRFAQDEMERLGPAAHNERSRP